MFSHRFFLHDAFVAMSQTTLRPNKRLRAKTPEFVTFGQADLPGSLQLDAEVKDAFNVV